MHYCDHIPSHALYHIIIQNFLLIPFCFTIGLIQHVLARHRLSGGLVREDPSQIRVWCRKGETPTWQLRGRVEQPEDLK